MKSVSFRSYLGGIGAGALAGGLQIVLYPWLITGILAESPERVGYAQMVVLLPALLFVLVGGALSERQHLGVLLFRLYLFYLVPYGLLWALAATGNLIYLLVVLFGVGYGVITSFIQPARESLLPYLTDGCLRQVVAKASLVQFVFQSIGILFAGWLDQVGLSILCAFQMVAMIVAAILFYRSFPIAEQVALPTRKRRENTIRDGLHFVWHDKPLRRLMSGVAVTGFLGLGVYLVVVPLLAREFYNAGAAFFAALQLTFTVGVIIANIVVITGIGGRWLSGRFVLWSLLIRGVLLGAMACGLPVWLLFPVVCLWGIVSGWSIVVGRSLTHEMAPRSHQSRAVSVYQLCLFGAAPIGAWVCGHVVAALGVLPAIELFGSLTVVAALLLLWRSVIAEELLIVRES